MTGLKATLGIAYSLVIIGSVAALLFAVVAEFTGWWDKEL